MRLHRAGLLALLAAISAGCQKPDVGARCDIEWSADVVAYPRPDPQKIKGDYLETGNTTCDSLVCIVSPRGELAEYSSCAGEGTQCGYCSKPCVSDAECYKSETGLVCRQIVLDPAYIAQLEAIPADPADPDGPSLADLYLSDARYSRYCATP